MCTYDLCNSVQSLRMCVCIHFVYVGRICTRAWYSCMYECPVFLYVHMHGICVCMNVWFLCVFVWRRVCRHVHSYDKKMHLHRETHKSHRRTHALEFSYHVSLFAEMTQNDLMHACVHACVRIHKFFPPLLFMGMQVSSCPCMHIYTHTHTHTHMHAYTSHRMRTHTNTHPRGHSKICYFGAWPRRAIFLHTCIKTVYIPTLWT
jgi:hypothetical protein